MINVLLQCVNVSITIILMYSLNFDYRSVCADVLTYALGSQGIVRGKLDQLRRCFEVWNSASFDPLFQPFVRWGCRRFVVVQYVDCSLSLHFAGTVCCRKGYETRTAWEYDTDIGQLVYSFSLKIFNLLKLFDKLDVKFDFLCSSC